ncbi:MAG: Rrf2 family transcriptional regulator [Fimbriimonadaceae bacterium]|nr:Rrf2 family transcriptional regulator [Fimbriimonadaceae bacterium]
MLNQSAMHAVRAMARLAAQERSWVRAKDLAVEADVPFHYLAKLLGQLVRAGLLEATRGKHGGYRLARPAAAITLHEVVDTIEPLVHRRSCLLTRRECCSESPCNVHETWSQLMDAVHEFLHGTSLADVVAEPQRLEMVLQ